MIPRLALISMLAIILSSVVVAALPGSGERGPYVDEHIWEVTISDDARLSKLLNHEVEAGGVPRPDDISTLRDEGFTITNEVAVGYSILFLNNRLYPFDDLAVRKAVNRLIDRERIVEELYTEDEEKFKDVAYWWLPPGQAGWINQDVPTPTYDPDEADEILLDAGYKDTDDNGVLNTGTPDEPGSGPDMPDFWYTTITPDESLSAFEMATWICDELNDHGLPCEIEHTTFIAMVSTLLDQPLDDWQMMTGIDLFWGLHEAVLYDFCESTQEPLWNCWGVKDEELACFDDEIEPWIDAGKHVPAWDESRLDWWCHEMKLTLDVEWLTWCIQRVQGFLGDFEPFLPLFLSLRYMAFTGDYDTPAGDEPGCIGIVNAAGDNPGGCRPFMEATCRNFLLNPWTKLFTRRETEDGTVKNPRKWTLPQTLDTLNPTLANSVYDWQILSPVLGGDMYLTPYYGGYVWDLVDGVPKVVAEDYEVGMEKHRSAGSVEESNSWTNPKNACASDNLYASAYADGSCAVYDNFGFPQGPQGLDVPAWDIRHVAVGIEAYGDGDDYLAINAFNGTHWTSSHNYTPPTSDDDRCAHRDVQYLGIDWTWNGLSQLKVKLTKKTAETQGTLYVDYLKVRVKIAPEGYHFGDNVTGMYVEYKLRPNMNWTDWNDPPIPITAADVVFGLNLLRFQDNARYRSVWDKIYKIEVIDELTVRLWYIDRFVFHFAEIGVFLNTPKHIWESYIGPETETLYDPFQDAYHDFWIGWDHHHSEWRGWENKRTEMTDYPGEFWTDLIGVGPFVYPHGGWDEGISIRLLANRHYIGSRICRGDVDINGICDLRDVFQILYRQGATPGSDRWEEEIYNMQGPAADIAPPAQWIGGEEIYVIATHFGDKWRVDGKPVIPPPCD